MALHLIWFQPSTHQHTRKEAGLFLFPVSHHKELGALIRASAWKTTWIWAKLWRTERPVLSLRRTTPLLFEPLGSVTKCCLGVGAMWTRHKENSLTTRTNFLSCFPSLLTQSSLQATVRLCFGRKKTEAPVIAILWLWPIAYWTVLNVPSLSRKPESIKSCPAETSWSVVVWFTQIASGARGGWYFLIKETFQSSERYKYHCSESVWTACFRGSKPLAGG